MSHTISEGDGIAIIVRVTDAESARTAQEEGAKALAVEGDGEAIREATTLPVLCLSGEPSGADAVAVRAGGYEESDLEVVHEVSDEEELESALELHDAEIFLISPREGKEDDALALALELLPDVPAGKLAIANVDVADRVEVLELERAGFDAVLVTTGHIGELVGRSHPDV